MKEARMHSLPLAIALVAGSGGLFAQAPDPGHASDPSRVSDPSRDRQGAVSSLSPEQRGDIFMARKMYRDAIEAYGQGPQDNAVLWNKAGIAWHQLGQLDRAKADYERALKLKPTYAEAINNIGAVYYAQKSYRRAIAAYKKALLIMPASASFHKNLGSAYFARKLDKESMAEYQEALRLDPETFENRSVFGTILEESNVADRGRYHYYLAKLYAQANRTGLSIQYLRKAFEEGFHDKKKLEQDPDFQAMRDLPEFQELLASEPRVL
jgi:tetratricopeptide (TPR) repeat protein